MEEKQLSSVTILQVKRYRSNEECGSLPSDPQFLDLPSQDAFHLSIIFLRAMVPISFILRLTHSWNVNRPAHERTVLACTIDTDIEGVMLLTHSLL